ncbi:MAG: tetratricopeptide repeat protein [Victivallaceae bacterium]
MGRFNSLELDAEPAERQQETPATKLPGEPIRDADFYLREAGRHYIQREYEPALRSYSKALEIDPGCADAWNGQINCLILLNELREADMWAKKAAEIIGESQELLALRARIFCRRGDFDRAYGLSDAAMQAPGNSPVAWVVRGEIMLYSKNKQPEHCFDKALAAARQDYTVRMDIAECCIYADKYTMAFKYLKPALDENPDSATLWMLAADCHRRFGNRKKALECLVTVNEIDPAYPGIEGMYARVTSEGGMKNLFRRIFMGH